MDRTGFILVGVNVALGLGGAWALGGLLVRTADRPVGRLRLCAMLLAVYMAEAFAFSASMATGVLSVGLAFLWGLVLPRRLRRSGIAADRWPAVVRLFAAYTSLPAASFLALPVVTAFGGWSVLSAADGARFGIPQFLPAPLNTILGFCAAVAFTVVAVKIAVTTRLANMRIRRT